MKGARRARGIRTTRLHGGIGGIACVFLGGALLVTAPARADDEVAPPASDPAQEAREQYQAGMLAYEARHFVEAALHFEAAVVQRPHAVALYTAALAWEQANRPERAADDFVRALDVQGLSASQAQNARDRLATLERAMGTLEVTAPAGWRVQLDANTAVLVPAHLHAMPGTHTLTIQAGPQPIEHRDVTLALGRTTQLSLAAFAVRDVARSPPTTRTAPPVDTSLTRSEPPAVPSLDLRRAIGFGVLGAGLGALAGGAVLGVSALSARDAYNAAPTQAGYDHASGLQAWTNAAFVAGAVLLAGGITLVAWPGPEAKRDRPNKGEGDGAWSLAPTLGGAVVCGRF